MLFSSITFLYYFLPITLTVYFITPMPKGSPRLRNIVILAASLVFYAWAEPKYVLLMAAQIAAAWGFGLLIERFRQAAKPVHHRIERELTTQSDFCPDC